MKILKAKDFLNSNRDVKVTGCSSIRMLVESDNVGFSVNKTIIPKGEPQHWHYPNHLEACYCVKGKGELVNLKTNRKEIIEVDTLYVLDDHDDHTFQALTDVILISIFNPPLTGNEKHDENGHYPPSESKVKKAHEIISVFNNTKNDYDAFDSIMSLL